MYSLNQLAKDLIKNLDKSSVVMGHDKSFSSLEKSIKDSPLEDQEKESLLKKIIELDMAKSIGIDL